MSVLLGLLALFGLAAGALLLTDGVEEENTDASDAMQDPQISNSVDNVDAETEAPAEPLEMMSLETPVVTAPETEEDLDELVMSMPEEAIVQDADDDVVGGSGDDVLVREVDLSNPSASAEDLGTSEGGEGNDLIFAPAGEAFGDEGDDILVAGAFEDDGLSEEDLELLPDAVAEGGLGDDTLVAAEEAILTGNEGSDTFALYLQPNHADDDQPAVLVRDFEPGVDVLLLSDENLPADAALGEMVSEETEDGAAVDVYFNDAEGNRLTQAIRLEGLTEETFNAADVRFAAPLEDDMEEEEEPQDSVAAEGEDSTVAEEIQDALDAVAAATIEEPVAIQAVPDAGETSDDLFMGASASSGPVAVEDDADFILTPASFDATAQPAFNAGVLGTTADVEAAQDVPEQETDVEAEEVVDDLSDAEASDAPGDDIDSLVEKITFVVDVNEAYSSGWTEIELDLPPETDLTPDSLPQMTFVLDAATIQEAQEGLELIAKTDDSGVFQYGSSVFYKGRLVAEIEFDRALDVVNENPNEGSFVYDSSELTNDVPDVKIVLRNGEAEAADAPAADAEAEAPAVETAE